MKKRTVAELLCMMTLLFCGCTENHDIVTEIPAVPSEISNISTENETSAVTAVSESPTTDSAEEKNTETTAVTTIVSESETTNY